MKKIYTTLVAVIAIVQISSAQWTGGPTGNVYYNGGNVGIGTTTPSAGARLDVAQLNSGGTTGLYIENTAGSLFGTSADLSFGTWYGATFTGASARIRALNVSSNTGASDLTFLNWNTSGVLNENMRISNTGYVGIGTTSPSNPFDVRNTTDPISWGSASAQAGVLTYGTIVSGDTQDAVLKSSANYGIAFQPNATTAMVINKTGSVGIGTTSIPSAYILAVNGAAIATSVTVKLYANWPDYVFKKDYKLPSLLEVKNYIDKNQHLPDMPSEAAVIKNGVNPGEMVKLQTKKIEELTLYLIEKDKQVAEQQKLLADQQKINQSLQQQINQLAKNH